MKTRKIPKQGELAVATPSHTRPSVLTAEILGEAVGAAPAAADVPRQWQWHYRVLLSEHRRLLRERGLHLDAAAEPLERHSQDEADSATDEFDHDLALAQLSAEQDALYEVVEALRRIRDGTYGVCAESGESIPEERLRAVPWARFTCAVEARLERGGNIHRACLSQPASVRGEGASWAADEIDEEGLEEPTIAAPKEEGFRHISVGSALNGQPALSGRAAQAKTKSVL